MSFRSDDLVTYIIRAESLYNPAGTLLGYGRVRKVFDTIDIVVIESVGERGKEQMDTYKPSDLSLLVRVAEHEVAENRNGH